MEWVIIAFIFGAGLIGLLYWLRNKNITLKWFEWIIAAIGVLLLFGSLQHYLGSIREDYPGPGLYGALIFGIPALILFALVWQLVIRRHKKII
ncbi:MAG: dehalogenase [Dehalogenimonas sp.]